MLQDPFPTFCGSRSRDSRTGANAYRCPLHWGAGGFSTATNHRALLQRTNTLYFLKSSNSDPLSPWLQVRSGSCSSAETGNQKVGKDVRSVEGLCRHGSRGLLVVALEPGRAIPARSFGELANPYQQLDPSRFLNMPWS